MGWRLDAIIDEYTEYAYPKTRANDIKYIKEFEVQNLSQVIQGLEPEITSEAFFSIKMSRARMVKVLMMALLMLTLWTFATVQLRP
jgi:hypothetical protein